MSLRTSWPYVAAAGFALLISDAAPTRAQVTPCDINPDTCLYSGTGRLYWYPQGYRRPNATVTPVAGRQGHVGRKKPSAGKVN